MNRRGHRIFEQLCAEDCSSLPRYMVPASTSTSMPEVPTLALAPPLPPMVLSSRLTAPDPLPPTPTLSSVVWLLLVPVPELLSPLSEDPVLEVPVPPLAPVPVPAAGSTVALLVPGPVPVSAAVPVPVGVPAAGSAVAPLVPVVAAGVETVIAGLTDAEAADALLSIAALAAVLPVPLALADVPGPLLLAVASPLAKASVLEVLPVVSTEPSELASICAEADAEPSPAEVADRSICADEEAEAEPSPPVLALVPEVSTLTVPVIAPLPVVAVSTSPSAVDSTAADVPSEVAEDAPSPKAWPVAEPSPVDVPLTLAAAVVLPSSLDVCAAAAPEAEASVPVVVSCALAVTPQSLSKCASVALSAVELSVAVSLPVAPAWVEAEESAVLPLTSSAWPLALPSAEAVAPAPSAVASECDEELVAPPPAVEWLSECPLAEAASAAVECSAAIGAADSRSAKALVETISPHLNRGFCICPPRVFGIQLHFAVRSCAALLQ